MTKPRKYIKNKFGRKVPADSTMKPSRVRRPQQAKGEMFGIITRILSGTHLEVACEDEKIRVARIPGKFRRRRWLQRGDLVVVEPWYGLDEDEKCDLIHRYRPNQVENLKKRGLLGVMEQFL
ncbi:MAG: translation initiation factor IF-1A [Candidatus Hodarchaeota archaeon]